MMAFILKFLNPKKMIMTIKKLFLFFIILFISSITYSDDDCVFNPTAATNPFKKFSENYLSAFWGDEKKEGYAISKNKEFLYVKKWSCVRFGMDAKLIVMYSEKSLEDKQYWIEKALELGKITLDSHEYQFLSNAI